MTHYRPFQPTVHGDPQLPIQYHEIAPSPALKPYILCYWTLQSNTKLNAPFTYQIVSDGCVDLLINCTRFEKLVVVGAAQRATAVSIPDEFNYFGIRFLPGAFNTFFKIPLKELANQMLVCDDVWGNELKTFEAQLFSAASLLERIAISEKYLLQRLATTPKKPHQQLLVTLNAIYQHQGQLPLDSNAEYDISPRQLRRIFDRYVGISPKAFARVVRFQSVLGAMMQAPKSEWNTLFFDFGYYDQSHFIREFNDLYGASPLSANLPQK